MHTFNIYFTDGIILLNTISICNILDTFSITSPSGRSSPVICGTNAVCYNQLFLVILTSHYYQRCMKFYGDLNNI